MTQTYRLATLIIAAVLTTLSACDGRHILTNKERNIVYQGAKDYGDAFGADVISVPGVDTNYDGLATAVLRDRKTGAQVMIACNYTIEPGCRLNGEASR